MTLTTIDLDDDLLDWINKLAKKRGITRSKVINSILRGRMLEEEDYNEGIKSIEESRGEPLISKHEMMRNYLP